MNLSSLAGVVGQGFGGQAKDQEEALRRAMLNRSLGVQDNDQLLKLATQGFRPVNAGAPQTTDAALQAAGTSTGTGMGGPGWSKALEMASAPTASTPTLTQNIGGKPQQFAFDYESSPQGRMETRQQNVTAQKDADTLARANAATSGKLSERARQIANRMTTLQGIYKGTPAEQLKGIAEDDTAFAQAIKPDPNKEATWTAVGTPDADGNIIEHSSHGGFRTSNIKMGTKPGTQGGLSGNAQNMQARLLGAVSEGRLADQRMDAFVAKHTLPDGSLDVSSFQQIRGNLAGLDPHNMTNAVVQGVAEGNANQNAPEYQQFLRDAKMISRAEQLMSARGGSEAMAHANELLSRGGAHAPALTLSAASKSRKALFGNLGAVVQTLSPDQLTKLNKGLAALQAGDDKTDYQALGQEIFGGTTAGAGGRQQGSGADPKDAQRRTLYNSLWKPGADPKAVEAQVRAQIP